MARTRSKDDADFEGPIRLLVAGGLVYALWLVFKPKPAPAAALPPAP